MICSLITGVRFRNSLRFLGYTKRKWSVVGNAGHCFHVCLVEQHIQSLLVRSKGMYWIPIQICLLFFRLLISCSCSYIRCLLSDSCYGTLGDHCKKVAFQFSLPQSLFAITTEVRSRRNYDTNI